MGEICVRMCGTLPEPCLLNLEIVGYMRCGCCFVRVRPLSQEGENPCCYKAVCISCPDDTKRPFGPRGNQLERGASCCKALSNNSRLLALLPSDAAPL